MTHKPLVSIIMPFYNASRYVLSAVESVRRQTYSNWELLIVDDGSKPEESSVLRAMEVEAGVRVFKKENGGPATARNHGIEKATGEYIAFLDADDLWHPRKLELQVEVLENQSSYGSAYNTWEVVDESFQPDFDALLGEDAKPDIVEDYSGDIVRGLFFDCIVHTSSVVLRRKTVQRVGLFDVSFRYGDDYDYWFRVAEVFPWVKLAHRLSYYRVHGSSITSRPHAACDEYEVLKRHLGTAKRFDHRFRRELRKRMARVLAGFAWNHRQWGDPRIALRAYLQAFRLAPSAELVKGMVLSMGAAARKGKSAK